MAARPRHRSDADRLGLEARAQADDHLDVRMWLRLLACSNDIELAVRQRLRTRFGTTLSRFDYLAQLQRQPDGLRMSELSRCLMVTGGNVTGLTDQLVQEGSVERNEDPLDGRASRVRLTRVGRQRFDQMATEHECWLRELFQGLDPGDKRALFRLLGLLRQQLHARADEAAAPGARRTASADHDTHIANPATDAIRAAMLTGAQAAGRRKPRPGGALRKSTP